MKNKRNTLQWIFVGFCALMTLGIPSSVGKALLVFVAVASMPLKPVRALWNKALGIKELPVPESQPAKFWEFKKRRQQKEEQNQHLEEYKKQQKKKKYKPIILGLLFFISFGFVPQDDLQTSDNGGSSRADTPIITLSEDGSSDVAPETTPTPVKTPESEDTPTPTPTGTPTPTNTPTPKPTNTPTPKPTNTSTPTNTPTPTKQVEVGGSGKNYVLNTNTYKFHYPSCSSVDRMAEHNKWFFTGTRQEVIDMGYSPCQRCYP